MSLACASVTICATGLIVPRALETCPTATIFVRGPSSCSSSSKISSPLSLIGGIDELLCRTSSGFVFLGRTLRKIMHAAMHIGIVVLVVAHDRICHEFRLLGCSSIIEIHELVAVHLLLEDRKVRTDRFDVV